MYEQKLSYVQAIKWAISAFFNNLVMFLKLFLFWLLIYMGIAVLLASIGALVYGLCYAIMGSSAAQTLLTKEILIPAATIILLPLSFYVLNYYWASFITVSLKAYAHEQRSVRDSIPPFRKFNHFFKIMLIWMLVCLLALLISLIPAGLFAFYVGNKTPLILLSLPLGLLLAIPAIIFFINTCFIDLLTIDKLLTEDKKLSWRESYSINKKLIFGHRISYFFFIVLISIINYLVLILITKLFMLIGIPDGISAVINSMVRFGLTVIVLLARTFLYRHLESERSTAPVLQADLNKSTV